MSAATHLIDTLSRRLTDLAAIRPVSDGVKITTHCMYPSNGLVSVTVRGGASLIVASDEGGAIGEALAAGIPMRDFSSQLAHRIRSQGLRFSDGIIHTPKTMIEAAPMAVLLVANASKEIAFWMYEHVKIKPTRNFRLLLSKYLKESFKEHVAEATIVGHSRKPHHFTNVISFANSRRLIIDPAVHDASSINARVVANLDVKANNDPLIEQRIVYDDEDDWTAADLNLLQVGASAIPFSHSEDVIRRLATDVERGQAIN